MKGAMGGLKVRSIGMLRAKFNIGLFEPCVQYV